MIKSLRGFAIAALAFGLALPALAGNSLWPSVTQPGSSTDFGRVYNGTSFPTDTSGNWFFSPLSLDLNGQMFCANCNTVNIGGAPTANIGCNSSVVYDASTSGATQLVALVSGKSIYVCGYTLFSGGTANIGFVYGTGVACASGQTKITPAYQLIAQTGLVDSSPVFRGLATAASNALCINTSAGVAVQATVYYTQF